MDFDFDKWNVEKKMINQKDSNKELFFHAREIWWCSMGLNIGVESNGKHDNFERPVLIVVKFNTDMVWVLPLTTKHKNNGYCYKLNHDLIKSSVVISQIKTISTKRLLRKLDAISENDFGSILQEIQNVLKNEIPLAGEISEAEATNRTIIDHLERKSNNI